MTTNSRPPTISPPSLPSLQFSRVPGSRENLSNPYFFFLPPFSLFSELCYPLTPSPDAPHHASTSALCQFLSAAVGNQSLLLGPVSPGLVCKRETRNTGDTVLIWDGNSCTEELSRKGSVDFSRLEQESHRKSQCTVALLLPPGVGSFRRRLPGRSRCHMSACLPIGQAAGGSQLHFSHSETVRLRADDVTRPVFVAPPQKL
ncbi:hypothetical protein BDY21DRAFT_72736 [Lineolata rhizophorae]|uniref:Uncharacterized protein n=1 Tax=Lineolata rhizophorae TaxID=578093 RepID=A0A6A6NUX2_9PEZI|nr:hypothetical protein BDY21DRAFT_72736 [Lineolata rhizophorae]